MALTETPVPVRAGDSPEAALGRLRRLLDVCVALNSARDVGELLATLVQTTTVVLRCEAASILLYDDRGAALRFIAASGDGADALRDVVVPLDGSLAGTIFREDRPLLATDLAADPRHFAEAAEATGVRPEVLLGVPMRADGAPIGVLEALNPTDGTFDQADAETLLVIAAQAAVALRNAWQRDALASANARLEEADQARVRFLSIASHELRTPLATVRGYAEVLADEAPAELRPFVDEVLAAGQRMTEIVETVEEMIVTHARPGDAAVRVTELFAAAQAATGRALTLDLTDARLAVRADPTRLRLAVSHLVRNAVAFTPPGGTITLSARAAGPDVTLCVCDTGRGIAPEHLERIFEPFYQVDATESRAHEGLGVGLSVARAIVARAGGRLWATSAGPGRGTTLHLRLPRADAWPSAEGRRPTAGRSVRVPPSDPRPDRTAHLSDVAMA